MNIVTQIYWILHKAILINSNPIDIRKLIFQESAKNNIAISEEKRNMILKEISNKLDTDAKTIEKIMWSDLEENTILDDYYPIDPRELLFNYNVSLIQTLLFNCLRMEIKINSMKERWFPLERSFKKY